MGGKYEDMQLVLEQKKLDESPVEWTYLIYIVGKSDYFKHISSISLGEVKISWLLKIEPIVCPETSVNNYYHSLRNNPEQHSLLRGGTTTSQQAGLFPLSPMTNHGCLSALPLTYIFRCDSFTSHTTHIRLAAVLVLVPKSHLNNTSTHRYQK